MARKARIRVAGVPWHVIQRGHNQADCFFGPSDFTFYLSYLQHLCARHRCAVHSYVLMTNHVHLLMTPEDIDGVSRVMQEVAKEYARRSNIARKRSGALWGGRFRSSIVQSSAYLFECHRYIESNPVRAGMVAHPVEYTWSSYLANAEGARSTLITPHPEYLCLSDDETTRRDAYRGLFGEPLSEGQLAFIRNRTRAGFAIGGPEFEYQIEKQTGLVSAPTRRPRSSSVAPVTLSPNDSVP